jgi:hypothetical protein
MDEGKGVVFESFVLKFSAACNSISSFITGTVKVLFKNV